jgi:thiamine biosynthesis lipoprotein
MAYWEKFRALGSETVIVIVAKDSDVFAAKEISEAKKEIFRFEQRFSRFIRNNELDRLNRAGGKKIRASKELIGILLEARRYYARTGKIFDPTTVVSLAALGYDKNFPDLANEKIDDGQADIEGIKKDFFRRTTFSDLMIDEKKSTVCAPKNFRIDLGGIGKGYLADLIRQRISRRYEDFFVSLGGDLILSGRDETGKMWSVGVQDPSTLESILLSGRAAKKQLAVATSGIVARKGQKNNFVWHHLIDSRSGLPADNDLLSVTVFASTVTMADVFAKTVLILGGRAGLDFIGRQPDCACMIINKELSVCSSGNIINYFIPDEK